MPGRSDDLLRAVDVGHTRQLHQDLIGALLRDARLGDAELVDAALDRLARLHDRLFAQRLRDVRAHPERVGAVRAGAALEVDAFLLGRLAERLILRRRHAVDAERSSTSSIVTVAGTPRRFSSSCSRALSCSVVTLQRVVGLHAQHEMHASLEVEPELQLPIAQPLRRRQVVARRQDRIDADPEEDDEDDEEGDEFPA